MTSSVACDAALALALNESEMTPTLTPEPSMPNVPRAVAARSWMSPSERFEPHRAPPW